jgi:hypothetical protein
MTTMAAAPDAIKIPARLLAAAGEALDGDRWQTGLAKRLNLNARTTQRWAEAAREDRDYLVSRTLLEAIAGHLEHKFSTGYRTFEQVKAVLWDL